MALVYMSYILIDLFNKQYKATGLSFPLTFFYIVYAKWLSIIWIQLNFYIYD